MEQVWSEVEKIFEDCSAPWMEVQTWSLMSWKRAMTRASARRFWFSGPLNSIYPAIGFTMVLDDKSINSSIFRYPSQKGAISSISMEKKRLQAWLSMIPLFVLGSIKLRHSIVPSLGSCTFLRIAQSSRAKSTSLLIWLSRITLLLIFRTQYNFLYKILLSLFISIIWIIMCL